VTLTFGGTTIVVAKQRHRRQVDVSAPAPVAINGSFVSPLVERFGRVQAGRGVFVAGNTVLRADPGRRVCLGAATNVQDNVFVLALGDPRRRSRHVCTSCDPDSRPASLAHQAEVINSQIGNFTFIGFLARLLNAVVENGASARRGGPPRPHPAQQDRRDWPARHDAGRSERASARARGADGLAARRPTGQHGIRRKLRRPVPPPRARCRHRHLALSAHEFNPGLRPTIASVLVRESFARIVGDLRLGRDATVGRRTSIPADEGRPIMIGANAHIETG
jgi:carbon dioxide concentrating mechanism protein CcmM